MKIAKTIKKMLQPGNGLFQRTLRSGIWVLTIRIIEQVLGVIRLIILARILTPDDFGLMGIVLLAMTTLDTFSQTGFGQALIQKKNSINNYLDTAWTATALRGLLIFAILFFAAPIISNFFNAPLATPIIRVVGLAVFLQGLTNIGVIYFQKELEFNKQFVFQLSGTTADFIVAVSAALLFKNVWALVFGMIAGNLVRLVVSYIIHPFRPHINFDTSKIRELISFGRWIFGSSILVFLLLQGNDIYISKVLGLTVLGFYQMAYRISNVPATEISHVISQVTFPAYSILQDNMQGLREGYIKTLSLIAFIAIPLSVGIFILSPSFTNILLGSTWMPSVPIMQALCIFGVIRAINATMGSLLQGIGKPQILTVIAVFQLIIMAVIIYPLTLIWGVLGVCIAGIIPNIFAFICLSNRMLAHSHMKLSYFIKPLLLPILGSIIMALIMLPIQIWGEKNLFNLISSILLGIGAYLSTSYILDRKYSFGLRNDIVKIWNTIAQV